MDIDIKQFEPGKMYVLGGRPAMGKTMLALNLVEENIIAGKKVLYCSAGLSKNEIIRRLLISMSRTQIADIDARTESALKSIEAAKEKLNDCRLFIEEENDLGKLVDRLNDNDYNDLDLVVIDTIQLMKISESERFFESEIVRTLKDLCENNHFALLVLSQISSKVEKRKNHRPRISNISYSSLSDVADVVFFIYREAYYYYGPDRRKAEIIMQKHFNRCLGTINIMYMEEYGRFHINKEVVKK